MAHIPLRKRLPPAGLALALLVLTADVALVLSLASVGGRDRSLLQRYMDGSEPARIMPRRPRLEKQ